MHRLIINRAVNYSIAGIWIINGFVCKILNMVPRHQQIISSILGAQHSRLLTTLIGIAEIIMAVWILSRFQSRLNAIVQILVISTMNVLEFVMVPELLLWGKFNSIFAAMLVLTIYINEFVLQERIPQKA
jgi:hypothetical protein